MISATRVLSFAHAALLILCLVPVAARCSTPDASQYIHDAWGADKGYLGGPVYSICQSSDGYLWIGTERGLVRFDGYSFVLTQRPAPDAPPFGTVRGLANDANGNLWIQPEGNGVSLYRNGHFEDAATALNLQESVITALAEDRSGNLLISGPDNRTVRYSKGSVETLIAADTLPGTIISLAETRDDAIWMGTQDDGIFRELNGHVSSPIGSLSDKAIVALVPAELGTMWIGTEDGIFKWHGQKLTPLSVPSVKGKLQVLAMARDIDGNIWVGTKQGLLRIDIGDKASFVRTIAHPDEPVRALYYSRDGAIWLGTSRGIERLREGTFRTFTASEGLPAEINGPVYADDLGRVWFAPLSGGLYWLFDGAVHRVQDAGLDNDVVYSISGRSGEIWVGRQNGGLTVLRENAAHTGNSSFTAKTYTTADGLAQNSVDTVHCNRDGSVWAGTVSGGASLWKDGRLTTFTMAKGAVSNSVNSIVDTRDGATWFATLNGLAKYSGGLWSRLSTGDGLPSANVRSLYEDRNGVLWIATSSGLAYRSGGGITVPQHLPELLGEEILGMTQDSLGALWIVTSDHILEVNRDKLLAGTIDRSDIENFGAADGLQGTDGVRRDRSVVTDSLGRVWISLNRGLAVADPISSLRRATLGRARIESMLAGSDPVDLKGLIHVAPGIRTVVFNYASTSLSVPDRIRYRYTLDGSGQGWSRVVSSRQVVFSNLDPGKYEFHVTASNADGLWNGPETTVAFEITPQFWQTWWFRVIGIAAILLLIFGVYQLRVAQLMRQLDMRFQERLAERTRIAQDLHDTLLQGVLSASMQLDVAEDRLPEDSPAKPMLQRVLQLMSEVINDGRRALTGLRSEGNAASLLENSLSRLRQDFPIDASIDYRVLVQGESRLLRPIVRDDIWRIGREAVVNAVLHSGAVSIEVDVEYMSRHLRLSVRDDGRGIDPKILQSGREGHWGLTGMRERSESIGAAVKLRSRVGAGTEVELTVPGSIAFADVPARRVPQWIARLIPAKNRKSMELNRQENNHD